MEHISSHMGGSGKKKDRATERGELMQYFIQKLNMARSRDGVPPLTMGRMGRILVAIPTQDLYFLKSICDDAQNRGDITSFSKKFWWEVKPKPDPAAEGDPFTDTAGKQNKNNGVQSKAPSKRRTSKKPNQSEYDA